MEIIKVVPRGYCQGVVRAIQIARRTAEENPGKSICMLGMIVHNRFVVEECEKIGIRCLEASGKTRLELLDQIQEGIVIFTAHGVSDEVKKKAVEKGLQIVDATCLDVEKTHHLIRSHIQSGDVIYIGKRNHPESEGAIGISPRVHLVSDESDLETLSGLENVMITNQTTLSLLDTVSLIRKCLEKYPSAIVNPEICSATTMRQKAVMKLKDVDLLIVVGDPHSNNSNQLREIGKKAGIADALLIETANDLKEEQIRGKKKIAVTSGSSTPTALTDAVIETLEHYAQSSLFQIIPPHQAIL